MKKVAPAKARAKAKAKAKATSAAPKRKLKMAPPIETLAKLREMHPDAHCELDHQGPFQLLVATVLSAQTTDVNVNKATPKLFARFPDAKALAAMDPKDVEPYVSTLGFFRQKSKSIVGLSKKLVEEHGGEVPRRMEDLVKLPGVGRKTANVVLNMAFGQPTLAVDTHIFRIGNRLGIAPGKTTDEVEKAFLRIIPNEYLRHAHHWLILHGRYVCKARKPDCGRCVIADICKSPEKWNSVPAPLVQLAPEQNPELMAAQ